MLYRKIQKNIENWLFTDNNHALLITGARQVGKSYIIRETLKIQNVPFVEFNLINQKEILKLFQIAVEGDVNKFLMYMSVLAGKKIEDNSIIFFDEVQECKEIVTMIKFLVEKGKYKYILSGSLLGVELTSLRSAPVGYLTTLEMYPLDLEEFLIANGINEDVLSLLKKSFDELTPVDDFIHKLLIDSFYKYLIIGGMPEAVQEYLYSNDLMRVKSIHENIYLTYKRDFTKYEEKDKLRLIVTYDLIPSELNSKNKRYSFSNLPNKNRYSRYENSFNWLIDAGVALPTYNVTEFQIPLAASKKSNLFKLFLSDVGMLTSIYGTATIMKLLERGKEINCGAIFENAVAQELVAHGFKLFYFNNKKHGEVDFLIEYNGELLPIEIKSGKDYQTHSSLTYFTTTKQFKKAIVFSNYNVKSDNGILYLPIYMIMFLHNGFKIESKDKLDLSILSDYLSKK